MMQVWLYFFYHADVVWQLLQGGMTDYRVARSMPQYYRADVV